jgi:hypothetical protein
VQSKAQTAWRTDRSTRIDNLVAAHRAVTRGVRGRQWVTEEINHALILRLAAEFQGFCRDLHDECIDAFLAAGRTGPAMDGIVRASLHRSRAIDSRNATWGTICSDFGIFGVDLATELKTLWGNSYPARIGALDRMNKARNAIAHDDRSKLAECSAEQPLTLVTIRRWRATLGRLGSGLDKILKAYLAQLTGLDPW